MLTVQGSHPTRRKADARQDYTSFPLPQAKFTPRQTPNQSNHLVTDQAPRADSSIAPAQHLDRPHNNHELRAREPAAYAARSCQQACFRALEVGAGRVQGHAGVGRQLYEFAALRNGGVCVR